MSDVMVPVVRHYQKGKAVYVGHLTAQLAEVIAYADHYPPAPGRTGYQRPPDVKRAQAFAQHLKQDSAGIMTPILLNARHAVTFMPIEGHADIGHLVIGQGALAAIVDGQHRSLGVERFLGNPDYPVPFMLVDNLDIEAEQQLFITINREQKRVSMSHVHFVSRQDDPIAEFVARLESDPESPWYRRVNLVGAKGTKRPVSLQSLRSALEALLQPGEVRVLPQEEQYRIALGFWRVVASVWPDAWQASRNSLLTKSMGTLAVAKLGGYLLPLCLRRDGDKAAFDQEKMRLYLSRADEVNWMSSGTFRGFAGRHGADQVKVHLDGLIFGQGAD